MTTEDKKITPRRTAKKSRAGKALNEAEKAEAIALWRAGSVTLDELAKKFDRSRGTFIRLFNAQGVAKGEASADHAKKIAEAVETAAMGDVEVTAQRIKDTKEEHFKIASGITKLTWSLIVDARNKKLAYGAIAGDLKALKYASDIFKTMRDEKYALLGLNEKEAPDDGEVDELIVQEVTQAEILEMQRNQPDQDDLRLPNVSDSDIEDVSGGDIE